MNTLSLGKLGMKFQETKKYVIDKSEARNNISDKRKASEVKQRNLMFIYLVEGN